MHIAQGIFKAINVNKCTMAGGTFVFWVADWFALMNDKMGGDMEKTKTVGKYLIEVWKATGMDMSRVKFLWSSDEITNNAEAYWGQALDIARRSTLARIKKCCQIMGRSEDALTAAQIMYPIMQATDVFFLKADICQLGVDQRKVNMLARDYCDWAGRKKPVILSHHMLYGLKAGQPKMSKSDPDSAIFMEDAPEDVERKIRNAYCPVVPEEAVVGAHDEDMHLVKDDLMNPCLDYLKHILFSREGYTFTAGDKAYAEFEDVTRAFKSGAISEELLKDRLIEEINSLLEPVRKHFQDDPAAKELLSKVRQWKKENLTAPSTLTRLKLPGLHASPVFAVFAPMPREDLQLGMVLDVLRRLQLVPQGSTPVLWLGDWSAMAVGCLGASQACIKEFYESLLSGLRALAPETMQHVHVCWQGEAILSDPSAYWISVINAGRRCSLEAIRAALPADETLEYASQVIFALMHVGDVLALAGTESLTLCSDERDASLDAFAARLCADFGLAVPAAKALRAQPLRLQAAGCGGGVRRRGNSDESRLHILLSDSDAEVARKLRKAFCEPGNVDFNPPLAWLRALLAPGQPVEIRRASEHGGDVVYEDLDALEAAFALRSLHPGDLKGAALQALSAARRRLVAAR